MSGNVSSAFLVAGATRVGRVQMRRTLYVSAAKASAMMCICVQWLVSVSELFKVWERDFPFHFECGRHVESHSGQF